MIYRRAVNARGNLFHGRICIVGRGKIKQLKMAYNGCYLRVKFRTVFCECYEPVKFECVGELASLRPPAFVKSA